MRDNIEVKLVHEATDLTTSEKIAAIAHHFRNIMLTLGLNLEDDSLKDTPMRVAKMFVNEAFMGLNPLNEPAVSYRILK